MQTILDTTINPQIKLLTLVLAVNLLAQPPVVAATETQPADRR